MTPEREKSSAGILGRVEIPAILDGADVLMYAVVTPDVESTNATRHVINGVPFERAAALAIAQYEEVASPSHYLFYLSDDGAVMTDTAHDSLEAALAQAEFEYRGLHWVDAAAKPPGPTVLDWASVPE